MLVVLTTTSNESEAESLARKIIEMRLAACVQVMSPMKSFYFWDGEIQVNSEHLLLIKTLAEKFEELEEFIKTNHSYDEPEIVALETEKVSLNYQNWMKDYLK